MRIIYLTTSMEEYDFKEYLTYWSTSPNPSNQNFHNKMIRALAKNNEVFVISIRPYSKHLCSLKNLGPESKTEDGITWEYTRIYKGKIAKLLFGKSNTLKLVKKYKLDDSILFVDTINPSVVAFASNIVKKTKIKSIGIVTDSPSNISGTRKSYAQYLLKNASNFDGYIALTQGLDELYNKHNKPSIIIEGIAENTAELIENPEKPYFFFGGALLERYGIYDLIRAFKKFDHPEIRLLVAGHHEDKNKLSEVIGDDNRIEYLGGLPLRRVLEYEKGALANINPRPYNEDLDRYSIPSKTIEYLASGRPTISVKNTKLQKLFPEEAIWAKSSSEEDLLAALNKVYEFTPLEREELGKKAREKVLELFSLEATSLKLDSFIKDLK